MPFYLTHLFILVASLVCSFSNPCGLLDKDSPEIARIVELADTSTLGDTDVEEFESRMLEIREIFVNANDRRGIFASIYAVVTTGGLNEVNKEGVFEDPTAMRRLVIEFAKTYLNSLKGYFGKGPNDQELLKPQWRTYFEYAENFEKHPLFVLTTAMNTHITLDLVDAILQSKMRRSNKTDFIKMGDNLITNIDGVINAIVNDYDVNSESATSLLKGFALKNWSKEDGRSQVGNFSMHYLRNEAWEDAEDMADWVADESLTPPETVEKLPNHWMDRTEWWTQQQFFRGGVYFAKDGWSLSYSECDSSVQDADEPQSFFDGLPGN